MIGPSAFGVHTYSMSELSNAVSIHPYFKVQEGKLDAFKETMMEFVARSSTEDTCLYYDFSTVMLSSAAKPMLVLPVS